jgi:hypothetical protein
MISAVPPPKYCNRFFDFMQKQVVINQDAIDVTVKEKKLEKIQRKYIRNSYKEKAQK